MSVLVTAPWVYLIPLVAQTEEEVEIGEQLVVVVVVAVSVRALVPAVAVQRFVSGLQVEVVEEEEAVILRLSRAEEGLPAFE